MLIFYHFAIAEDISYRFGLIRVSFFVAATASIVDAIDHRHRRQSIAVIESILFGLYSTRYICSFSERVLLFFVGGLCAKGDVGWVMVGVRQFVFVGGNLRDSFGFGCGFEGGEGEGQQRGGFVSFVSFGEYFHRYI